jgi:fibronectin type 3 domain-containing protein
VPIMLARRTRLSCVLLGLLAVAALVCAPVAVAIFTNSATGGPLTVSSATLSPPSEVKAAQVNCKTSKSPEIKVEWSAPERVRSYVVERATSSSGPYTALATFPATQTSYTDTSAGLAYSTIYYYRIISKYDLWSATSASASAKTSNKNCQGT